MLEGLAGLDSRNYAQRGVNKSTPASPKRAENAIRAASRRRSGDGGGPRRKKAGKTKFGVEEWGPRFP
jgi:hypothetical protein